MHFIITSFWPVFLSDHCDHCFLQHNTDTGGADHSCSICGKSLSSASSLDRHMLVHSGERPYKCAVCGQSFTTNGNMHRWVRAAFACWLEPGGWQKAKWPSIHLTKRCKEFCSLYGKARDGFVCLPCTVSSVSEVSAQGNRSTWARSLADGGIFRVTLCQLEFLCLGARGGQLIRHRGTLED